ncbi:MAG: cytochrome c family protein [Pseudomonadota bacterium]
MTFRYAARYAAGLAVALGSFGAVPALAEGDPDAGARVFRQCQACHVADAEQNKVGPHLVKIINRPASNVEGFNYSPASHEAGDNGLVWTEDNLKEYLENPRTFMQGTRMAFAGLRSPEQIADVIAYLKENAGVWDQ